MALKTYVAAVIAAAGACAALPATALAGDAALQDPEQPMCVGVQTSPIWGDKGEYEGNCRFGAPLGPMNAAVRLMDRRQAVGTAREYGLSERFGIRLQIELDTIAGLPFSRGVVRLKRHAKSETRAAEDSDDDDRPSFVKRAATLCALWGSIAATAENLWQVFAKHKRPDSDVAKAAALGCAFAVISPPLHRWIKSKGFDLDD